MHVQAGNDSAAIFDLESLKNRIVNENHPRQGLTFDESAVALLPHL